MIPYGKDSGPSNSSESEILPKQFTVRFEALPESAYPQVRVALDNEHLGDVIDDNNYEDDGYRYHDVFHYSYAALLGWSPCSRSMMKRKRKSDEQMDRIEDGARAMITEEAISLILFNEAKANNFYEGAVSIDTNILKFIRNMTAGFEVADRSEQDWENAILKGYEMFRLLVKKDGGLIAFDTDKKTVAYCLQ